LLNLNDNAIRCPSMESTGRAGNSRRAQETVNFDGVGDIDHIRAIWCDVNFPGRVIFT
jgi:hypothetical protein